MADFRKRDVHSWPIPMISALLLSACGVVRVIEPAKSATISIDPCSLSPKASLQTALGGPANEPERTFFFEKGAFEGRPVEARCNYFAPETGNSVTFEVEWSKTLGELEREEQALEPVTGIGKEALIKPDGDHRVELTLLSSDGVHATIDMFAQSKSQEELASAVKKLGETSVEVLDRSFPGRYQPKTSSPPVSPCSILTIDEVASVMGQGLWQTSPRVSESIGGMGGGNWSCTFMTPDASQIFFANLYKTPVGQEVLSGAGATRVKKLGSYAFWKEGENTISVMSPSGRYFELHGCTCVTEWKGHAPKLAEKAIARV